MLCELLLRQLNELRLKKAHCDLELIAKDNTSFHVHKIVLTALNQRHFLKALKTAGQEKTATHSKMFLSLVLGEELEILVEFMYGATIRKKSRYDILVSALAKLDMTYLLEEAEGFVLENDYLPVKTETDDNIENPASVIENITSEREHLTSTERTLERNTDNDIVTNTIQVKQEPGLPDTDSNTNADSIDTHTSSIVIAENLKAEPELACTGRILAANDIDTNTNTRGVAENLQEDANKTVRDKTSEVHDTSELQNTEEIPRDVKIEVNQDTVCKDISESVSELNKVHETLKSELYAESCMNDGDVDEVKYSEMSPLRVNVIPTRERCAQSTGTHNNAKQSIDIVSDTRIPELSQDNLPCRKENCNLSPSKKLRSLLPVPSVYLVSASVASKMSPELANAMPGSITSVLVTISKPSSVIQPSVLISRDKARSIPRQTATTFPGLLVSTPDSSALSSRKQSFPLLSNTRSSTKKNTTIAACLGERFSLPTSVIPPYVPTSDTQVRSVLSSLRTSTVSSTATMSSSGIFVSTSNSVISPYVSSPTLKTCSTLPSMITTVISNTNMSSPGMLVSIPKSVVLPYVQFSKKQTCSQISSTRTTDLPTSEISLIFTQSSGISTKVLSPDMPSSIIQTCSPLTSSRTSEIPTTAEISVSTLSSGITTSVPKSGIEPCVTVLSPSILNSSVTKYIKCEEERFDNSGTEKQTDTIQLNTKSLQMKSAKRKPLFKKSKEVIKHLKINSSVGKKLDDEAEHLELDRPKSPAFEKEDGTLCNDLQETDVLVESAAAFFKIAEVAVVKKENDNAVSSDLGIATTQGQSLNDNVSSDLTIATTQGQSLNDKVSSDLTIATTQGQSLNDKVSSDLTIATTQGQSLNDKVSSDLTIATTQGQSLNDKVSSDLNIAVGDNLNVNSISSDLTVAISKGSTLNDDRVVSDFTKATAVGETLNGTASSDLTTVSVVGKTFNEKTVGSDLTIATATGGTLNSKTATSDLIKATIVGGTMNDDTVSRERDEQTSKNDEGPEDNFNSTFNDSETPIKSRSNLCIIPSSEILKLTPDDIVAVKRKKVANIGSIKKMESPKVQKKVAVPETLTQITKKTTDSGNLGKIESVQKSCQISLIKVLTGMKQKSVDEGLGQMESIHKSSGISAVDRVSGTQNEIHKSSVELENKRRKIETRPCAVFVERGQSEQSGDLELDINTNLFGMNGEMNTKPADLNDESCTDTSDEVEERCVEVNEHFKEKECDKIEIDNKHQLEVCCTGSDVSSEILSVAECKFSNDLEKTTSSMFIWEERHTVEETKMKTNLDKNVQQIDTVSELVVNQDLLQQANEECSNDIQMETRLLSNSIKTNGLSDIHTESELNDVAYDQLSDEIEEIQMHYSSIVDSELDCSESLSREKCARKETHIEETDSLFQVQSKSQNDSKNEKVQSGGNIVQSNKSSGSKTNSHISSLRTEVSQCQTVPAIRNLVPMRSTLSPNITCLTRPKAFTKTPSILPKLPITMVRFPLSLQVTGPSNKLSLCQLDAPVITNSYIYPNQKIDNELDTQCETRKRKESGSEEKRKRHKSEPGNMALEKEKQFKELKRSASKELISAKRPISSTKDSKRKKSKKAKKSPVLKKKRRNDTSIEGVQNKGKNEKEVVKSVEPFLQRFEQMDSDVDADVPLSKLKERMKAACFQEFEKKTAVTGNRSASLESVNEASSNLVCELVNKAAENERENTDNEKCISESQADSSKISKMVVSSSRTQHSNIDKLRSQLKLLRANIQLPCARDISKCESEKVNTVFESGNKESNIVMGCSRNDTEEKSLNSMDCDVYYRNKEIIECDNENEYGHFALATDMELEPGLKNETNSVALNNCSKKTSDHSEIKSETEHAYDETKIDKPGMIIDLTMHKDKTNVFSFGIPGVVQEKVYRRRSFADSTPVLRKALMSPVATGISEKFVNCKSCKARGVTYSLDSQTRLCRKCIIRHGNLTDKIGKNNENTMLQKKKVEFDLYRDQRSKLQENLALEKAKRTKITLLRKRRKQLKAKKSVTAPACNKPAHTSSERIQSPVLTQKSHSFEEKQDEIKDDLNENRTEVVVSELVSTSGISSVGLSVPVLPKLPVSSCSSEIASEKTVPIPNVFHAASPVLSSPHFPASEPKVVSVGQLYTPVLSSRTLTSPVVSASCHTVSSTVASRFSKASGVPVMSPQTVASSIARALPVWPSTVASLSVARGSNNVSLVISPQTATSSVARALPVLPSTAASLSVVRGSNNVSLVISPQTVAPSFARALPVLPSTAASLSVARGSDNVSLVIPPQTVAPSFARAFPVLPSTAASFLDARGSNNMSLVISPQTVAPSVARVLPVLPSTAASLSDARASQVMSPQTNASSVARASPVLPSLAASVSVTRGSNRASLVMSPQTVASSVTRASPDLLFTSALLSDAREINRASLVMLPNTVSSSATKASPVLSSTAVSSSVAIASNRKFPVTVSSPYIIPSAVVRVPNRLSSTPVLSPTTMSSSGATVSNGASPKSVLSSMLASQPLASVPTPTVLIFKSPGVTQKNQDIFGNSDTGTGYRSIQPKPSHMF